MSQSTRVKAGSASVLEQPHLDVHEERVCVEEAELKGPTPTPTPQLHEDPLAVLRRHRNTHSSGPSKPRAQHEDAPTPRTTFPRRVLVSAPPHSPPQQMEEPPEAVQVDVLGVDEDPPADERADEESLAFVMLFEFLFEQDGEKLLHVERMDAFAVWWYGSTALFKLFSFAFLVCGATGVVIALSWTGDRVSESENYVIPGQRRIGGILLSVEIILTFVWGAVLITRSRTNSEVIMLTNHRILKVCFHRSWLCCGTPIIRVWTMPYAVLDTEKVVFKKYYVRLWNRYGQGDSDLPSLQLVSHYPKHLYQHIKSVMRDLGVSSGGQYSKRTGTQHAQGSALPLPLADEPSGGFGDVASAEEDNTSSTSGIMDTDNYRYLRVAKAMEADGAQSTAKHLYDVDRVVSGIRSSPPLPSHLHCHEEVLWSYHTPWRSVCPIVLGKALLWSLLLTTPFLFLMSARANIAFFCLVFLLCLALYFGRLVRNGVNSSAIVLTRDNVQVVSDQSSRGHTSCRHFQEMFPLVARRDGHPGCWRNGKLEAPLSHAPEEPKVERIDLVERAILGLHLCQQGGVRDAHNVRV